jgi:hypothetical protein
MLVTVYCRIHFMLYVVAYIIALGGRITLYNITCMLLVYHMAPE